MFMTKEIAPSYRKKRHMRLGVCNNISVPIVFLITIKRTYVLHFILRQFKMIKLCILPDVIGINGYQLSTTIPFS